MSQTPTMTSMDTEDTSLTRLSSLAFLGAFVLFVTSLLFPVFITETNDIYGFWVLAMGWLGFVAFQFAWYATPLAILAVQVSSRSPQIGLVVSIIAILMASQAFLFTQVPFGRNDKVLDYDIGFYIWYLSFYLVAFGVLMRVVAWGSIEEEGQDHSRTKQNSKKASIVKEGSQAASVKRKIIKQPAMVREPIFKAKRPDWYKKSPPPLPKKNIYAKVLEKKVPTETAVPPPLPVSLGSSVKQQARKMAEPPPLPVKKTQDLGLPPFLKTSK